MDGVESIEKALQALADCVSKIETVERIKIVVTLVKPKPSKANHSGK